MLSGLNGISVTQRTAFGSYCSDESNLFFPRSLNRYQRPFDCRVNGSQSADTMCRRGTHGVSVISSMSDMRGVQEGMKLGTMMGRGKGVSWLSCQNIDALPHECPHLKHWVGPNNCPRKQEIQCSSARKNNSIPTQNDNCGARRGSVGG